MFHPWRNFWITNKCNICKTKRTQLLSINFLLCICCSLKCSGHHDKSCIMKQIYPTPRNRQCHWSFQNILNILRHKVIRVYQYNYNFKYYDDVVQIEWYQAAFFSRTCICTVLADKIRSIVFCPLLWTLLMIPVTPNVHHKNLPCLRFPKWPDTCL